ncbi:MAG: SDR family oxidoreductase [Cyclobacteriaceae bacterium]
MKVLITGANGLLGQKLVQLLSSKTTVIATSQGPSRFALPSGVTYHSMDITNNSQVSSIIVQLQPQAVIHAAAMTQVDKCEQDRKSCLNVNVNGTRHVAEAAKSVSAYLIHMSTDFIFDGTAGPYDEEATPAPVNYYGECKLAAEMIVEDIAPESAILRTILVYGWLPNMSRSNIILWVKESLEQNKTIQVVDDQWRTPTLVEDLAQGCWLALERQAAGIYHIAGSDFITPFQMARETAGYFDLDKELIKRTDSTKFTQPAKRPLKTGFVIAKAESELGYKPHTFSEGIAILAGQMNANKMA